MAELLNELSTEQAAAVTRFAEACAEVQEASAGLEVAGLSPLQALSVIAEQNGEELPPLVRMMLG